MKIKCALKAAVIPAHAERRGHFSFFRFAVRAFRCNVIDDDRFARRHVRRVIPSLPAVAAEPHAILAAEAFDRAADADVVAFALWAFGRIAHERVDPSGLKIQTALGNGALFLFPPNFNRPRRNLISPRITKSCHHAVTVRAGIRQTTVAPPIADSYAFLIHNPMLRPQGGFIQQTSTHSCKSPSCSAEK